MPGATGQDAGEARTSIDALVELLRTKGKSELNTIAVQLGADPKIVERWAKVLESGGMARISYEVGRMYLEPIVIGKEEVQSVKVKLGARESILEQSTNVQRAELDKFAERITGLSMSVANIESVYRQRMPEVQLMLAEINKAYAMVESEQKGVNTIKQSVETAYGDVNRRINDLSSKIDDAHGRRGREGSLGQHRQGQRAAQEVERGDIGDRGAQEDEGQVFRVDEEEHGRAGQGSSTGSLMRRAPR